MKSSFFQMHKSYMKLFGVEAAVILTVLTCERSPEELFNGAWFCFSVESMEEITTLSAHKQRKALVILQEVGIVDVDYRDLPKTRYIQINWNKLNELLNIKRG